MTTDEVLAICKRRGLVLSLNEQGQTCIAGPQEQRTPSLMAILAEHKPEIVRRLGGKVMVPWLVWTARDGKTHACLESERTDLEFGWWTDSDVSTDSMKMVELPEGDVPEFWQGVSE